MKSRINLQTNKYENKQRKKTLLNVCFSIFFLRDKLSGLLQTCTIGLIRVILIVNYYGVGWKDYLRSHLLKWVCVFWWSRWRCSTKVTSLTTIELNQMKTVAQVLETSAIFTDNTSFWNYPRPTNILISQKILVLVKREINFLGWDGVKELLCLNYSQNLVTYRLY